MAERRDTYVVGRLGSYSVPTTATCDAQLRLLARRLEEPAVIGRPELRDRITADMDALLEHRLALSRAVPA